MAESTVTDVTVNRNDVSGYRDRLYGIASTCRVLEMAFAREEILEAAANHKVELASIFEGLYHQLSHIGSELDEMLSHAMLTRADKDGSA